MLKHFIFCGGWGLQLLLPSAALSQRHFTQNLGSSHLNLTI